MKRITSAVAAVAIIAGLASPASAVSVVPNNNDGSKKTSALCSHYQTRISNIEKHQDRNPLFWSKQLKSDLVESHNELIKGTLRSRLHVKVKSGTTYVVPLDWSFTDTYVELKNLWTSAKDNGCEIKVSPFIKETLKYDDPKIIPNKYFKEVSAPEFLVNKTIFKGVYKSLKEGALETFKDISLPDYITERQGELLISPPPTKEMREESYYATWSIEEAGYVLPIKITVLPSDSTLVNEHRTITPGSSRLTGPLQDIFGSFSS